MKKSIFVIVFGLCSSLFFATNGSAATTNQNLDNTISYCIPETGGYIEITLDEVIPAVRASIEGYLDQHEIVLIEFDSELEYTRVTFQMKAAAPQEETLIVVFDKNGTVID